MKTMPPKIMGQAEMNKEMVSMPKHMMPMMGMEKMGMMDKSMPMKPMMGAIKRKLKGS